MSHVTGVISYRAIEYADVLGFRPLELDLYLPDGLPGPVPAVVHVHAAAPPVLLMHGGSDVMVPADQSIRLARALTDAGGTVTLELVPGASHFWDGADDVPGIVARSAGFVRSIWQ